VKGIEGTGKCIFFARHADKVDVVVHKAVGPDLKGIPLTVFLEPFQVLEVIVFCLKYCLAVITALGDVVGVSFGYCSGYSRHGWNLTREDGFVKKNGRCPYFRPIFDARTLLPLRFNQFYRAIKLQQQNSLNSFRRYVKLITNHSQELQITGVV